MNYSVRYWIVAAITLICFSLRALDAASESVLDQPVDIVYLWVDGNDPEWLAIKNSYIPGGTDGYEDKRFADNQELRYSMRSICKYAPFFNHIYIVTMSQRPSWLGDHPKVTIINHKEIFKDRDNLPTFNSHALESNLHRIPHLSDYFIYFNDDVFLGNFVSTSDFFTPNGKIKVLFEKMLSPSGPLKPSEIHNPNAATTYRNAWRNTNIFLDTQYKKERRYRLCHAPFALRRSFIAMAEREFAFIFASNSSHRFRSDGDYNIVNGLLQYYWMYHDNVVRGDMTNMMVSLKDDQFFDITSQKLETLKEQRPDTFCIQDSMSGDNAQTKKLFRQFLEQLYPEPAPWEK